MAKVVHHGKAQSDDPIYSTGIVFGGCKVLPPKKDSAMDEIVDQLCMEITQVISEKLEDDD